MKYGKLKKLFLSARLEINSITLRIQKIHVCFIYLIFRDGGAVMFFFHRAIRVEMTSQHILLNGEISQISLRG